MKYLIKTKDPRAKEVMEEFARVFEEEYTNELKKWRYKPIKKFLPMLVPVVMEDKEGVIFALPIKPPDFKTLRKIIEKFTGQPHEPKWKQKTIKILEGYLKSQNINFESVEYVEEES